MMMTYNAMYLLKDGESEMIERVVSEVEKKASELENSK